MWITHHITRSKSADRLVQRKPVTVFRPQPSHIAALSRSWVIHFMRAKGCIGFSKFGTFNDNIDNVDWLASIDVSYNPVTNQSTYGTTVAAIYIIQERQMSKVFIRVHTVPGFI